MFFWFFNAVSDRSFSTLSKEIVVDDGVTSLLSVSKIARCHCASTMLARRIDCNMGQISLLIFLCWCKFRWENRSLRCSTRLSFVHFRLFKSSLCLIFICLINIISHKLIKVLHLAISSITLWSKRIHVIL